MRKNKGNQSPRARANDISNCEKRPKPILHRQGYYVLPSVLLFYLLLLLLTGYNQVCTVTEPFANWTSYYYFAASFSFLTAVAQQTSKIYFCWRQNFSYQSDKGIYYMAAVTVSMIAGTSSFLTYSRQYGGICRDSLGMDTPAAQWSEWLTCVPLMAYIAVAVEDKPALTRADYFVIIGFFFVIACGVVMNCNVGLIVGVFFFIIGTLTLVAAYCVIRKFESPPKSTEQQKYVAGIEDTSDEELIMNTKKTTLTLLMFCIFPLFPMLYLFAFFGSIDRDLLYVGFVLLSVIAKLLFVSSLIEEQVSVTEIIICRRRAEALANDTRRAFLRYIFHELRIPLNTITMGMAVIADDSGSERVQENYNDALIMMNGATSFIDKTLNDVLFVHEIEEGAEMQKKAFQFECIMSDSLRAIQPSIAAKNLDLILEYPEFLTTCSEYDSPLILGDKMRIENVVLSLLGNAVNRSTDSGKITIKVCIKYNDIEFPSSNFSRVISAITPSKSFGDRLDRLASLASAATLQSNASVIVCGTAASEKGNGGERGGNSGVVVSDRGYGGVRGERKNDKNERSDRGNERNEKTDRTDKIDLEVGGSQAGSSNMGSNRDNPMKKSISTSIRRKSGGGSPSQRGQSRMGSRLVSRRNSRSHICEVSLIVIDEGIGMSKDDLDGLMLPYSQIRPDHLEQERGTGLWLVIAREIISLHGGELTVESDEGLGSSFGFSIPFELATRSEEQPSFLLEKMNIASDKLIRSVKSVRELPFRYEKPVVKKYLIVDDTPSNSKMLAMLLRTRKIECTMAANGLEAVNIIEVEGKNYDFIFMDFTMPVMNGGDATALIRAQGYDRLIFGLTGNALNDDVTTFLASGADCVLLKPLRLAQMDAILKYTKINGFKSNPKVKFQVENVTDQECSLRFL